MKAKPLSIKLIALAYLLAPIVDVLQISYFNHWPLTGPRAVFYHFDVYDWYFLAAFPIVAFGIWKVARWGYILFLFFAAYLILQNTYNFLTNRASGPYVMALFQLLTFGAVGFFLREHVFAPYFNPKIRWWETRPRYKVQLVAHLRKEQSVMKGQILDISQGGCFLELKKDLALGDSVWLNMAYKEWHVTAQARVVWVRANGAINGSQGFGLMFTALESADSKKLQRIVLDLQKNAKKSQVASPPKSDSALTA